MKYFKLLAAIGLLAGLILLPSKASAASPQFIQGGNSFGQDATLGTNDPFSLVFETNNTERLKIDTDGSLVLMRQTGSQPSSGRLILQGPSTDAQPGDVVFIEGGTGDQLAQVSFENGENALTLSVSSPAKGSILISRENGNTAIGNAFSFVPPQGTLQVVDSGQSSLYVGASESSPSGQSKGCIVLGDSDGDGVTYITANDGVLSASTTKPSICD